MITLEEAKKIESDIKKYVDESSCSDEKLLESIMHDIKIKLCLQGGGLNVEAMSFLKNNTCLKLAVTKSMDVDCENILVAGVLYNKIGFEIGTVLK